MSWETIMWPIPVGGGKKQKPAVSPAPPPVEVEPIPEPSPSPMPAEVEEISEAKKGVKRRAQAAAGRASTILAGKMMQKRDESILSTKLGQSYGR